MNHSDSCPSCGLLWGYDGAADSVLTCDGITYGCPCGARFPVEDFDGGSRPSPENCDQPWWHDTHRFCPDCTWSEEPFGISLPTVYGASKTRLAPLWRELRDAGVNVISSWIDRAGEPVDYAEMWRRCISEISVADALVAVHEPGDVWKGAYVEIGVALAHVVPVYVVGDPPGSFVAHPLVFRCRSVHHALEMIGGASMPEPIPCDGCGETDSAKRCLGCLHDFGPGTGWRPGVEVD